VLEQEHRFSCVLLDCSDVSINFLDQLYGGLVPGAGGFNCHWQKDVRGRERAILVIIITNTLVVTVITTTNITGVPDT